MICFGAFYNSRQHITYHYYINIKLYNGTTSCFHGSINVKLSSSIMEASIKQIE